MHKRIINLFLVAILVLVCSSSIVLAEPVYNKIHTIRLFGPVPISPAPNTSVPGTSITFQWYSVPGAVNYGLGIFYASGVVFGPYYTTNTSITVSGFPSNGAIFRYNLWAYVNGSWGVASALTTFTNSAGSSGLTGSGTSGAITKFTGTSTIGDATNTDTQVSDAVTKAHTNPATAPSAYVNTSAGAGDAGKGVLLDTAGKLATNILGGTGADNTKYLRGDQTWQVVSSGHTQGTDQGLDTGGTNATTAGQVKTAVTNSHVNPATAPSAYVNTSAGAGDAGKGVLLDVSGKIAASMGGNASGFAILDATSKIPTVNLGGSGADNTKYLRGDQTWQSVSGSTVVTSIVCVINGGSNAITTGIKSDLEVPFACTITQVTLLSDQTGSIVINIWKAPYANFPPTIDNKITASAPPTITDGVKYQDATLTGWAKSISAGDILRFNVDSCTTITKCTLSLKVTRD